MTVQPSDLRNRSRLTVRAATQSERSEAKIWRIETVRSSPGDVGHFLRGAYRFLRGV